MNDKWLETAMKIQSLAQSGLAYCNNPYDKERYEQLRDIACEMLAEKTNLSTDKIKGLFCNEQGYQTPKVDTRAAIFKDNKILLVHENNGTWSLPGGWCDVDQSIATNTIKEVKEETGYSVKATKLIAVHDWRKHNVCNYVYGVVKTFIMCEISGGEFTENIETSEIKFFAREELPENLANEKATKQQILTCFAYYDNPALPAEFD